MTIDEALAKIKPEIKKLRILSADSIPKESVCLTCVQDCQFIGCDMPNIKACTGYIRANDL